MTTPSPINVNISGAQQEGLVPTFGQAGQNQGLQVRQSMDVDTTRKDVENITVVKVQDAIRTKIAQLRRDVDAARKADTVLRDAHNKELSDWSEAQYKADTRVNALAAALLPFTSRPLIANFNIAGYNERSKNITGTVTIRSGDVSFAIPYEASASQAFIDRLDAIRQSERTIKDIESSIMAARTALTNENYIRTQAAASLASTYLKNTAPELLNAVEKAADTAIVDDLIAKLQL